MFEDVLLNFHFEVEHRVNKATRVISRGNGTFAIKNILYKTTIYNY